MKQVWRILLLLVGVAVALLAGVFGLALLAVLLAVFGLSALFGKGRLAATTNRAPRQPGPGQGTTRPESGCGDVIDIEATKVEPRRTLE